MKSLLKIVVAIVACLCMHIDAVAQDVSFSQTYQAPLYLSPSYTGLTNGSRFGLNYRNQWPGIGHVYQDYAFFFDHFFDQYHSGIGFQWVCDNMGKGLMLDNQMSILYSYEVAFSSDLFFRPGIAFEFGQRKIDQSKMITYTDIAADGRYHMGGSSIEFDRTKKSRFDAAVSAMIYNDTYSFGVSIDHLLRPDASFTDTKDKIGTKVVVDGSYRIEYEPSYRGSEPKSITIAADFRHQYSFNQLELGLYWYFFPIEDSSSRSQAKNAIQMPLCRASVSIFLLAIVMFSASDIAMILRFRTSVRLAMAHTKFRSSIASALMMSPAVAIR